MSTQPGSFVAYTEDGKPIRISVVSDSIDVTSQVNRGRERQVGYPRLVTDDGRTVIHLEKGKYEIDGTVLTSDDANAP